MKNINWKGVYPAVTTQYFDDMFINIEATQNMVDSLIKEGFDGITTLGTVGENCSHTREEKCVILQAVVEVVAGRVLVTQVLLKQARNLPLNTLNCVKTSVLMA